MPARLRRVPADRRPPGAPLPRRAGPRVHDRARSPVHAPDALGKADRGGRREDRGRHGRRGRSSRRRRRSGGSSRRRSTSSCATSSIPRPAAAAKRIVKGLNASPGAAVGRAVFDADDAVDLGRVAARRSSSCGSRPRRDDFHGMAVAEGIITARGGATSHAAVVARQIGKPCVAGSAELVIDYGSKDAALRDHRDRLQGG